MRWKSSVANHLSRRVSIDILNDASYDLSRLPKGLGVTNTVEGRREQGRRLL